MELEDRCIASRVEVAMSAAGVDLPELARRTGLSEAALVQRLAAPGSFRLNELGRIALALDCSPVELAGCSGDDGFPTCCRRGAAA
ncbi:helix-turn-helix transcriptional regulator [Nocardia sp. CDC159]|uniref:Helix-turn-helix transcriptional regulator n=1 Tax=Nocardia pulmonis TaxID=2951408 RepID=A0A9X2EBL3_9NOCA|nr:MULTISPECIES: helix-turn-helix transcriptional regulator [Nocardia]MCM6777260.1 helix-turn-helix transcriptional regulator [Nocardia pulmonis]MCM6790145.1 helix-turn-helix transcriptional regulator [Nocardia sp. CDC159]